MKKLKISVLLAASLFLIQATTLAQSWYGMQGEGPKVTRNLDLDRFDGFSLSFNAKVFVSQGNTQSVEVEAQQNILDNIETAVKDGRWNIKFDKNVRKHEGVTIWITLPTLTEATISGSGDIIGETAFKNLGDLKVGISGSGDIKLEVDARDINTSISGSGDIMLAGSARSNEVRVSGSGDVNAGGLATENCNVRISGSGDVEVNASENLDISTSGSGDVYYGGRPRVKAKVSGSGKVEPRGEG